MARSRANINAILGQGEAVQQAVAPDKIEPEIDVVKFDLMQKCTRLESTVKSQLEIISRQDNKILELTDALSTAQNKIVALQKVVDSSETIRPEPKEAMVVQNPLTMVEVAEIQVNGVFPTELVKYSPDGKNQLRYSPKFDFRGMAHYHVPLEYAESLLSNQGGRKYVLVCPATLRIRVSNGRHGYDQTVINANYDIPRVF